MFEDGLCNLLKSDALFLDTLSPFLLASACFSSAFMSSPLLDLDIR